MRNQCRSCGNPSSLALRSCRATFLLQDSCRLKYFTSLLWKRRENPHGIPPLALSPCPIPRLKILPQNASVAKNIQVWCPRGNFPPQKSLYQLPHPQASTGVSLRAGTALGDPRGLGGGQGGQAPLFPQALPHPSAAQPPTGHFSHFYSSLRAKGALKDTVPSLTLKFGAKDPPDIPQEPHSPPLHPINTLQGDQPQHRIPRPECGIFSSFPPHQPKPSSSHPLPLCSSAAPSLLGSSPKSPQSSQPEARAVPSRSPAAPKINLLSACPRFPGI